MRAFISLRRSGSKQSPCDSQSRSLLERARELERKNRLIRAKYQQDAKYARLHKRLLEKKDPTEDERKLFAALSDLKREADERLAKNSQLLNTEAFAEQELQRLVIEQLKNVHHLPLNPENARAINRLLMKEYLAEFHGEHPA